MINNLYCKLTREGYDKLFTGSEEKEIVENEKIFTEFTILGERALQCRGVLGIKQAVAVTKFIVSWTIYDKEVTSKVSVEALERGFMDRMAFFIQELIATATEQNEIFALMNFYIDIREDICPHSDKNFLFLNKLVREEKND